jgi:transcriptional regulator NrdR family protein
MTVDGCRHRRRPPTERNDAMKCPDCGYARTQVKDTRTAEDGTEIRRKRKCPRCNIVTRTYEITAGRIDQVAADFARIRAERDNALASLKTPGVSDGQDVEAVS